MSAIGRHNPLEINPIWLKGLRERCRLKHLASWGVMWLTLAVFTFLITYLTMTEQEISTKAEAAKAALPSIFVIQAIVLMFFGTGAVAAGVSQERDEGLLDYVRMTPMSPTAKIVGYLFGLPAREYVIVVMTMPLVLVIVAISGLSLLTLAHFYLVFFSSVIVYHMTALVVGTVSPRPRLASITSMSLVFLLYFALPNFSRMGLTFFEFLTIRPTFLGLIQQEMPEGLKIRAEMTGIDSFRPVPFFEGTVRPTLYTMAVQLFLIGTMFSVVHRRWRDQHCHLFSKAGALVVFVGVAVFTFGSVWAVVVQDDAYNRLFNPLGYMDARARVPETFLFLLLTGMLIVGGSYVFLMAWVSASRDRALAGLRASRRLGRHGVGLNSDAASSLPVALVMLAILIAGTAGIIAVAARHGDYIASAPAAGPALVLLLIVVGMGLFVQGLAEWASVRVFAVGLFLVWLIPAFTMMVTLAAFEEFKAGFMIGQPFPPISIGYSLAWMLESTAPPMTYDGGYRFMPPKDEVDFGGSIAATGAVVYTTAGLLLQTLRLRGRRALRSAA